MFEFEELEAALPFEAVAVYGAGSEEVNGLYEDTKVAAHGAQIFRHLALSTTLLAREPHGARLGWLIGVNRRPYYGLRTDSERPPSLLEWLVILQDERLRNFKVDLERLEASVISYAVFTWQKFQRVLDEWKDPYKSSKNAYFVFRVLTLGEQLATYGRIVDLKASNHLWEDIKEVYDTLQIQPGDPWITSFWIEIIIAVDRFDTNVVEALLAHHFAESLRSFRAALAAAQHAQRDEAAEDAAEGAKPIVETCAVCLDALDAEQRSIKGVAFGWVQLVNCRHCFHAACIAKSLRARPDHPACPMCRASVRIDATSDPKLAPWFVREPTFPASSRFTTTRRLAYAGYPATLRGQAPAPRVEGFASLGDACLRLAEVWSQEAEALNDQQRFKRAAEVYKRALALPVLPLRRQAELQAARAKTYRRLAESKKGVNDEEEERFG
eukprot:g12213.t1